MDVRTQVLAKLTDVGKHYDDGEVSAGAVLADVSLTIERGEFIAITGPSGSGKSTLLSILGLLDVPSTGSYVLDGQNTTGLTATERAKIRASQLGFVFQSFNLIGDLSVIQNVELPLTYRGISDHDRELRVHAALERVGMTSHAAYYPAQLSGGQQQRVAVARAIAGDPVLLLADEPTGNLDSKNGEAIIQLLVDLHQQGTTICMVTHDERFAERAARRLQLRDGKVVHSSNAQSPR